MGEVALSTEQRRQYFVTALAARAVLAGAFCVVMLLFGAEPMMMRKTYEEMK